MAFEGCRNTYESIPNFSTPNFEASPTQDDGAYGSLGQPLFSSSTFNLTENHHTSRSNDAEDPFQLLQCTQNKTRNLSDRTDCDGATDLYSLVSNILEDGDSSDSYSHTERNSSKFMSIWSRQTIGDDLLQYSQSNTKTEASQAFLPYHKYNDQVQGHTIVSKETNNMLQQFDGYNTSDQWLSNSSRGAMYSYKPPSLKLTEPPGLPMPSMESCFLSAMRESQQNLNSNDASSGPLGPLKNIPIQKNGFGHKGKMDSHLANEYEDHFNQSSLKLYQQNLPQEVNQLVGNFQDLMATPFNHFQDLMERRVEENDQMKWTNSVISPESTLRMPMNRGLKGVTGPVQLEQTGDIMKHTFKGNYPFQGLDTKHIQQSTSASCNSQKSYQGKIITHGQTMLPNVNQVLNQYSQGQIQQSQLPNNASMERGHVPSKPLNKCQPVSEFGPFQYPLMQGSPFYKQEYSSGDGRNVHYRPRPTEMGMSMDPFRNGDGDAGPQVDESKLNSMAGGFVQDGFLSRQRNARLHTNTLNRDEVPRHGLPKRNHNYSPHPVNTYGSQRFGVGNSTANTGEPPQFLPRQCSFQVGVHSNPNLSFRPPQPYRSGLSCGDISDRRQEGDVAANKPNVAFQLGQSAGSMYSDLASTMSVPLMTKNRGGPMSQLHYYLEECRYQLTCLEKERKKSLTLLNQTFAGRRISVTTSVLPKMPPNPSRVDQLIVDQLREQSRVVNLLGKMERLSSFPFHDNISSSLYRHYEAICATQSRRREEYINTASRQKQGNTNDIMLLAVALKDLCGATRKSRTSLWCALQVTVPLSAGVLDTQDGTESNAFTEDSGT